MIKRMQAAIIKFVRTDINNSHETKRDRRSVPWRRADGGLPLPHLESVLRLFSPSQKSYKALPRFWVLNAGLPYNFGFSHLLSLQELSLAGDAPVVYRK